MRGESIETTMISLFAGICLVIGMLVPTLNAFGNVATKEEAIEISKNAKLFKEGIQVSFKFTSYADFLNSTTVEQLKLGRKAGLYQEVLKGHGVWRVVWLFFYKEKAGHYSVIIIVDAETGIVTHEEKGIEYL